MWQAALWEVAPVVLQKLTNISKVLTGSIIKSMMKAVSKFETSVNLKVRLHAAVFQKAVIFKIILVLYALSSSLCLTVTTHIIVAVINVHSSVFVLIPLKLSSRHFRFSRRRV
jgi:uncharacterized membrane protein